MNGRDGRPRAVSVIAYGTVAIGVFVLCVSSALPFVDDRPPHTFTEAAAGWALAICVILTGRALLRLRRWASLLIEALAAVFFLVASILGAFAILIGIDFARVGSPHALQLATPGIVVALVYAVPSFLTVRSLRSVRLRGLLV